MRAGLLLGALPHTELLAWHDLRRARRRRPAGDLAADALDARWRHDVALAMSRLYASGEAVFLESRAEIADWLAGRSAPGPEVGSLVLVPLVSPQAPPALLVGSSPRSTSMPVWQRRLVAGLVNQAGQAWGRAAAYDAQARAAATLQSSLLPTGLAAPEGLSLAARYVPGESGLRVGGDWFDCLQLSEDLVALVVGDVMGKGLHAAAVMGQVRTTTRTLARLDPTPRRVLAGLTPAHPRARHRRDRDRDLCPAGPLHRHARHRPRRARAAAPGAPAGPRAVRRTRWVAAPGGAQ